MNSVKKSDTLGLFPSTYSFRLASVSQLDVPFDWRPGGRGFNPRRGRQHSFMEIDHSPFR